VACAARTPPLHLVAAFPRTSATAPSATPGHDDLSHPDERRQAWCAAQAVSDAIARYPLVPGTLGVGLRGGSFTVRGLYLTSHPVTLRLRAARFCRDVPVSGTVVWHRSSGRVRATIRFSQVHAKLTWSLARRLRATMTGRAGSGPGRRLSLRLDAP
jgi:hypothetical protein